MVSINHWTNTHPKIPAWIENKSQYFRLKLSSKKQTNIHLQKNVFLTLCLQHLKKKIPQRSRFPTKTDVLSDVLHVCKRQKQECGRNDKARVSAPFVMSQVADFQNCANTFRKGRQSEEARIDFSHYWGVIHSFSEGIFL